ncbi:hypothetical protein GUITHDRAFT_79402, partial [Guillardia theta CCMP2712]
HGGYYLMDHPDPPSDLYFRLKQPRYFYKHRGPTRDCVCRSRLVPTSALASLFARSIHCFHPISLPLVSI